MKTAESAKYWIVWFLEISAYCAVNCYALISGYVGVNSKYKLSNLALLWFRVAFYSISITVVCKAICPDNIGNGTLLISFFPIISGRYWYFSSYALLFLFIPLLNIGMNRISKKSFRVILITIIASTSMLYPLVNHFWGDVFNLGQGYNTWWLMILYLIGGYIRKYGMFNRIRHHRVILFIALYFVSTVSTWIAKMGINIVLNTSDFDDLIISYRSLPILLSAIFLLLAFEKIQFHSVLIRIIAFLSPLAFSVYLIHEHTQIREIFIVERFTWITDLPIYQMVPVLLIIVVGIYLLCSAIDLVRHYLFKAIRLKTRLEKLENGIREKFGKT